MSLVIPNEIVQATKLSERELAQEIAIWLYEEERLTSGQASEFAKLSVPGFLKLLHERGISPHYDVAEFEQDIHTLQRLGRIK